MRYFFDFVDDSLNSHGIRLREWMIFVRPFTPCHLGRTSQTNIQKPMIQNLKAWHVSCGGDPDRISALAYWSTLTSPYPMESRADVRDLPGGSGRVAWGNSRRKRTKKKTPGALKAPSPRSCFVRASDERFRSSCCWCKRRVFFSVERKIPSSRWRRSPCKQPGYLHQPRCASPGSWPAPVLPSLPGTLGSEPLLLLPSEVWISKPRKANGCRDWILLLTSMAGKLQDTTNTSSSSGFSGTC